MEHRADSFVVCGGNEGTILDRSERKGIEAAACMCTAGNVVGDR